MLISVFTLTFHIVTDPIVSMQIGKEEYTAEK